MPRENLPAHSATQGPNDSGRKPFLWFIKPALLFGLLLASFECLTIILYDRSRIYYLDSYIMSYTMVFSFAIYGLMCLTFWGVLEILCRLGERIRAKEFDLNKRVSSFVFLLVGSSFFFPSASYYNWYIRQALWFSLASITINSILLLISIGVGLLAGLGTSYLEKRSRYITMWIPAAVVSFFLILLGAFRYMVFTHDDAQSFQIKTDRDFNSPNVVFITLDTQRADRLGCYGYDRETTPHIDEIAAESAVFLNTIVSVPATAPSHSCMMTSLYPATHTVRSNGHRLPSKLVTLAEIFKEMHYKTAAFVSSYVLSASLSNLSQGFDIYDDFFSTGEMNNQVLERVPVIQIVERLSQFSNLLSRWYGFLFGVEDAEPSVTADITTRKAVGWLNENCRDKFFLFIHYWDAHYPYNPPSEYLKPRSNGRGKTMDAAGVFRCNYKGKFTNFTGSEIGEFNRRYDGEIRWVDENIGIIIETLKKLGIYDKTLLVITGDHGENLGEHFSIEHEHLYDSSVRVPLIIRYKPRVEGGKVITQVVENVDILPTILDLIGVSTDIEFQGISLKPVLEGTGHVERAAYMDDLRKAGLRTDKYKLIYDEKTEEAELYDLKSDPREVHNVASADSETVRRLVDELRRRMIAVDHPRTEAQRRNLSEKQLDKLRSLGYLQ